MMNSISWQEVAIEKHLFASVLKHLQFIIKQSGSCLHLVYLRSCDEDVRIVMPQRARPYK